LRHITTTKFYNIMIVKKRFTKKIRDQIKASDRLSLDIAEALGNSRVQSTHKQIEANSEKLMLPNIVELVRKSLNIPESEVIIEAFRNSPKKQSAKS